LVDEKKIKSASNPLSESKLPMLITPGTDETIFSSEIKIKIISPSDNAFIHTLYDVSLS
jgi:hypothetical protein